METIARVPPTVADAVADPAGNIPPVIPSDCRKVGDGLWLVNWDSYLARNWDGTTINKWGYTGPSVSSVVRFVKSKAAYGIGFRGEGLQSTPTNQLDTSVLPNPTHPWVPGTVYNIRTSGEELFQSPAGTQEIRTPAAMVGTSGERGTSDHNGLLTTLKWKAKISHG